eukprot:CAMPEP_0202467942 /NCGR_PEP_ID=MMETSP1360-20130828/73686_1 /ASSEMBLY_ACC=CAM_ASM_000848 /TAXON_ID=515479 /ORGANISM="Licmophora paradoxa, Strain CCMP2313" /LENGTH=693 /DNA_ID=CAMNT_0049092667 /DNA_START=170 /DNA_END=2251 /DNA_ORIENTATION=-
MSSSISSSIHNNTARNNSTTVMNRVAANESVIDAYATKILKTKSPPEACIDDSLGPYVTSLLRCSLSPPTEDVKDLPEFDSLMELVQEHCTLDSNDAMEVLEIIAKAVRTEEVPIEEEPHSPIGLLGAMLENADLSSPTKFTLQKNDIDSVTQTVSEANTALANVVTPLKPDRLIPLDLLDDPLTPTPKKLHQNKNILPSPDPFPPLGANKSSAPNKSKPSVVTTSGPNTQKKNQEDSKQLAASLFHQSRSRQASIDESYGISPSQSTGEGAMGLAQHATYESQFYNQQIESTVDILLSMNPDLSENAASKAATMANGDINVAQYIVDTAVSAPPVCRHLLNDGCYRSDCQYSHDVEGHTCLFWLRGRCGKGENGCRFYHGFSTKILEGLNQYSWSESKEDNHFSGGMMNQKPHASPMSIPGALSQPMAIPTKNLVSHNFQLASSGPQSDGFMFGSLPNMQASGGFGSSAFSLPGNPGFLSPSLQSPPGIGAPVSWESPSIDNQMRDLSIGSSNNNSNNIAPPPAPGPNPSGFSFASIAASIGNNDQIFVEKHKSNGPNKSSYKMKPTKIPQDVWSPHINRSSDAFHIIDPMDRYNEVTKSVSRRDVVDLHFQSIKTFPVILETILPKKLQQHGEVWIVTGSGHHVDNRTHQKGGGALENAVLQWLEQEGYYHSRGRDRNGHGGCVLVKQPQR